MSYIRKILAICMVVVVGHISLIGPVAITAQVRPIGLVVNGQSVQNMPTPPVIRQDRMLVPARAVFESLGATVDWNPDTREVYIQYYGQDVIVTIGRTTLMVNGIPTEMPVPAQIINENTMIPLGAVAENLGFLVDYRDRTVFVDTPITVASENDTPLDDVYLSSGNEPSIIDTEDDVPLDDVYLSSGNELGIDSEDDVPLDDVYLNGQGTDSEDDVPLDDVYLNGQGADSEDEDYIDDYSDYGAYEGIDEEDVYRYDDVDNNVAAEPPPAGAPLEFSPNPVPSSMVLPAVDITSVYIPVINYPITSVVFAGMPDPSNQIYTIIASSPITEIRRTLLEDNRLAIDIVNSTTTLSGALPIPAFMSVSGLRVSQFTEDTTRVVFDLESGVEFSVSLSSCRTAISLIISQHTLQDISFEAMDGFDNIILSGVRPSAVRVQPGDGRLWLVLSNTQLATNVDTPLEGSFATHATVYQWGLHAAIVEISVNNFATHTIVQTGPHETTIRLQPANHRNILYNFAERTFRIPKTDGFTMSLQQVGHLDQYHQRRYILNLPINALDHLGFGNIFIADVLLHYVNITHGAHGTQLIFNGNQIFSLVLEEDSYYYLIRILNPRERYPRIVIIDPGHGGRFSGAVRNGVREADLNLTVTHKLLQLIEADGFIRAYTTRNSDVHFHEVLAADLRARTDFGNHFGDMFISIHFNALENTAVHGTETFFRESIHDNFRMLTSRNLAEIMQRHKLALLGTNDRNARSANFAVLRYSTIPAALLEIEFMSNPQGFARITTPEFQWQAARAIYNGLLEAFAWIPER